MSPRVEGVPRPLKALAHSSMNTVDSMVTAVKGGHSQHNGAGQQPGDGATVA